MITTEERPLKAATMWLELYKEGKLQDPDVFPGAFLTVQLYFVYDDGSILRWSDKEGKWQHFTDNVMLDWHKRIGRA